MRKADVLALYGNQTEVARVVGVTKSAVSQWREIIPERMAYRLQALTAGRLRVDPTFYRKHDDSPEAA